MSMSSCVNGCQEPGLRMAMHERPNLRPVAECEWLYSSGLTVTCIMSGSRASFAIHAMQAQSWLCSWCRASLLRTKSLGINEIAIWKVPPWQRVHAKITLNIARAVPSPPRDATMISTSFTVSSWQLSGDLTTAHYPSPLLGYNSHLVTLTSPNNSASNSRLYNAGCTGEAAQQRANELQLEAEETVVVQLTQTEPATMGFTLSTKDLAIANASECDQIKRVLEPFRQIFMTILENAENDCVSHFTIDRTYNPAIITLHPANGNAFSLSAKGRAAFPPSILYDMQTAILKFNQCDLSVLSFLCWIRDALRPIGATVDWLMIVSVRPLSILHYSDEEPVTRNGRHSVLAITTASREEYIADFTLEQFGYPAELWFLEKAEYLTRFVEAGASWRIASAEDMDDAHCDIAECDIQQPIRTCIDAVCQEIDWLSYYKLSAEERIPWLEARIRETVSRLEAEDEPGSTLEAA